jgi:glycosyltransferase involved in cell wall biosynthesis
VTRILHLIPRFPFFGGNTVVGGAAASLANLARWQATSNEVTILANVPAVGQVAAADLTPVRLAPVEVNARASSVSFGLRFTAAAPAAARRLGRGFDLVHGHSGSLDYLAATVATARRLGVPALHTFYCPATMVSRPGRWAMRLGLYRLLAARLSRVVAVSRNVAGSLSVLRLPGGRLEVVPPAVDTARFAPMAGRPALAALDSLAPPDAPRVLFVGNTTPTKNLETVLEAMALVLQRVPDAWLVVTTELETGATDARRAELARLMERLGIAHRVARLGIVPDMPLLMAACDVLVAPFLDTRGPSDYFMAALEAMAVGRPVVVSAVGGMPEVVDDEVGALADPRDAPALAAALTGLLHDPDRRAAKGRAARERAVRLFAPAVVGAAVDRVYAGMLS